MLVKVMQGLIQESTADTIIVNLFDDVSIPSGATGAVDVALNGAITDLIAQGDLTGKVGETIVLYPRALLKCKRVIVVGLGAREGFDLEGVRRAAAAGIVKARQLGGKKIATIVHGAGVAGLPAEAAAQAAIEGTVLALYRYHRQGVNQISDRVSTLFTRSHDESERRIEMVTVVEYDGGKVPSIQAGVHRGLIVAQGCCIARDLVNSPPNLATPDRMAATAVAIARQLDMDVEIGDRAWAAEYQMGAFLAVAKGAGDEPRFIILEHKGQSAEAKPVVIVGKGVTFDSGGISLKASAGMGDMKSDMGGAAAVMGAMYVAAALKLPVRVIGLMACTENKPDADAYRPSDVVTAGNGKSIEIISTDAEGRLALADALVFAQRYQPDAVVDLATLTGSAVVALGEGVAAGLFSNDETWRNELMAAADVTYERVWPMPLFDDYAESIKSDVADLKNSGGRYGGVGTSAKFLEAFTDYSWAHLDIAGMAYPKKETVYNPKGATGYGVRLLAAMLQARS